MKRFAAIALVVLLIATLFVGCSGSGKNSVPGVYKIQTINDKAPKDFFKEAFAAIMGEDFDLASLGMTDEILNNLMTVTLNEDGTAVIASNFDAMEGEEAESVTGTWKQEGDKVIITAGEEGDEPAEFTFKDGTLVITEEEDGMTMTMVLAK